ncbi:MAG: radical SAM protein, partial [Clostridiales bacterium]|nr:radical SAM protein [Clostridiales bacterium]
MGVYLLTLGCDKNRVDGEAMGGLLREAGYEITDDAEEAEVIIVNTCGFIRDAVRESIETVLELAKYKRVGACKKLIVTGCMAQRYRDEVLKEIPEADAVLGVKEYDKILDAVRLNKKLKPTAADAGDFYKKRLLLPVSHVAHVKIAEGCNNRCTYCTIPSIRGPYRSRHFENIVAECAALVKRGARELVLVAQDTALYGVDLYGRPRLHELLDEIAAID